MSRVTRRDSGFLSKTGLALVISLLGVGAMDRLFALLNPGLSALATGKVSDESVDRVALFIRLLPLAEGLVIALITWLALRVARPHGSGSNEYTLLVLIGVGMMVGRSFLGIGEGFSTDFAVIMIPGVVAGFIGYTILR
ncbi:hypothetical protein SAMN05444002_3352 [Vannielia litorea]|uniref:Uncharacterized protein n=2 Tax=Vannielia litorea TaxID=1217970 RepID=A0A1N6HG68_9RHOB|nr:hypothetical protein SAMN05444002_3352 [Vannielia litorea]